MRPAALGVVVVIAFIPGAARADHQVYWNTGASIFTTGTTASAGFGGGPGYRYFATDRLDVGASLGWYLAAGNTVVVSLSSRYSIDRGRWQPAFGLAQRTFFGSSVRVIDTEAPKVSRAPKLSLEVALALARFRKDDIEASVLALSFGVANHGSALGLALSVSILELGVVF